MAHTIKLKRTSTAGNKPDNTNITTGELALNTADKSLYLQTGTANTDIITLYDDGILHLDDTNNSVGISTTSPASGYKLHVNGNILANSATLGVNGGDRIKISNRANNDVAVESFAAELFLSSGYNGISFEGSGNTTLIKMDDSGRLGIGVTDFTNALRSNGKQLIIGDCFVGTSASLVVDEFSRFGGPIYFHQDSSTNAANSTAIDNNGNRLVITGKNGTTANALDAPDGFYVGGTQFINSSRNLVNIGTVSSGAITSSGQIMTTQEAANSLKSRFLMGKASGSTSDGQLYINYNTTHRVLIGTGTNGGAGLTVSGDIISGALNSQGNLNITNSGQLQMANTTVIDSSRNLVNIGTVSSGAITSSGNITSTGLIASSSSTAATFLSMGSSSQTSYTLAEWKTSSHGTTEAYILAYGASHATQAGNFAMKNLEANGEIFFELASGVEPLRFASNGAATFNKAFTFPTAIGSAGQVLKVPTSGTTLYWANEAAASVGTSLSDADGDTKIQVEETADEDRIRFDTAGTQRMVLNELGRLGINTGTPNYLLDIESTSSALLRIYNTGSNVLTSLIAQNDLGTAKFSTQSGYSRIHSGSTLTYAASTTDSIFYSSGTEKMRVTGTGLTIGTATDTTTLVFPDKTGIPDSPTETNDKVQLIKMGQSGNGGMWQTTGRGGMLISSADDSLVLANGDAGRFYDPNAGGHHPGVANETLALLSDFDIRFTTGLQDGWSGGSTYSPKTSIITADGRFGIGTTNPTDELTVDGSIKASTAIGINSDPEGYLSSLSARLAVGGNVVINDNSPILYLRSNSSGNASDIRYQTALRFTDGAGSESVRITNAGNLGINSTSPEAKLHNIGHSRLDGAILQKSNLSIGSGNISTGNEYISHNGPILTNGSTGNINQYGYFRGYQAVYGTDGTNGYNPYAQGAYSNPVFEFVSNNRGSISLPTDSAIRGGYLYQFVLGNSGSGGSNGGVELTNSNTTLLWGITSSNHAYFANRVGIGASSPANSLEIATSDPIIRLRDTDTGARTTLSAASGVGGFIINADAGNTVANSYIDFKVDNTTRMYINASGNVGIGTSTPARRLHVSTNNVGIATTYGVSIVEATDSQVDLISDSSGTWGSGINLVEGAGTSNTDVWSIVRQTTGGTGDSSLRFNFGTGNNHQNTNTVSFASNGNITSAGVLTSNQSQQGFKHIAPDVMSGHTSRNEMTFSWTADETRWYMFPTVDGSGNFGRELSFDYSSEEWSIEGPVTLSSLSTGNITTTGYLRGPSTFTIDPSAHGDNTGTVVIAGNLQVDGTTTTINSTTLTVDDKNITLASGAVNAAAASGAGITVDTVGAQLTYDATQDRWNMNKGLELIGTPLVVGTGATDIGRVESSSGVFSLTAYTTREIAFGNDTNGEHVRIDTDGNVGIGTSSPGKLLHVTGQGKFEGRVTIEDNAVPLMFNQADQSNGTVGKWWRMPVDGTSLRFDVSLTNDDAFSTYRDVLTLTTSGEAQVHGKLAVNNRSATAYIDSVVPDGNALSLRLGRADQSSYWDFNHAGDDLRIYNNDGTGSDVLIGVNSGGGILDNKVGIGTATPTQKLDVAGIIKTGGIAHPEIELVPSGSVGNADIRFDGTSFDIRSNSSSAYLTLQTSTTERMRITSDGKVGIGQSNPSAKLHVKDASFPQLKLEDADDTMEIGYAGENFFFKRNDNDGAIIFRRTDNSDIMAVNMSTKRVGIGTASPTYGLQVMNDQTSQSATGTMYVQASLNGSGKGLVIDSNTRTTSDNSVAALETITRANTTGLKVQVDGKVGIGTNSPAETLHVNSGQILVGSNTGAGVLVNSTGSIELCRTAGSADPFIDFKDDSTQDYDVRLQMDDGHFKIANTGGERVRVASTGNVGIGQNNPTTRKLEVYHSANAATGILVENANTGTGAYAGISFKNDAGGSVLPGVILNGSNQTAYAGANSLNVYQFNENPIGFVTGNTLRMSVRGDGKVGVGTNSPQGKFQVNGDIIVTANDGAYTAEYFARLKSSYNENPLALESRAGDVIRASNYGQNLTFLTGSNANGTSERMTIDANGNIVVGVSTPFSIGGTAKLSLSTNTNVYLTAGATSSDLIYSRRQGSGHYQTQTYLSNNTGTLELQPYGGNVGVGTNGTVSSKLQVEALGIDTTTTTTSATTEATIDSFAAATFRSARYTIQVTNTTDSTYHITEILLIHNGTTPNITEYGTVFTGTAAEATFDADISSGNVRLRATPASTDSMTFKVVRHCITV